MDRLPLTLRDFAIEHTGAIQGEPNKMPLKILHTNDFHGALVGPALEKLTELRQDADLYFDSGDCIKAGNLAFVFRPEAIWKHLADLNCDASVTGNRECHLYEFAVRMKLSGAKHPVLCGNLRRKGADYLLPRSLVLNREGYRIGVVSAMIAMVTPKMSSQSAVTLTWEPASDTISELAEQLRPQVDLLVALTHIGHRQDLDLAAKCPQLDIILGGHSHTVVPEPVRVGSTFVCQGGSHAKFAGVYDWNDGVLTGGLVPLK
jgi:5'-nucleotidase